MPPRGDNTKRMQLCGLPKACPISCSDCPAFHRLHTSRFSNPDVGFERSSGMLAATHCLLNATPIMAACIALRTPVIAATRGHLPAASAWPAPSPS